VTEAGTLEQDEVIDALDHAKIARGPAGQPRWFRGQHHARLNMYIAQAHDGAFKVVRDLGVIDPNESEVGSAREASAVAA
jgi:branched-chain amino acid transport system substrate-binding protein